MWKEVGDRETGKRRPYSFANRIRSDRIDSLNLSNYKEIVSVHRGAINTLQVFESVFRVFRVMSQASSSGSGSPELEGVFILATASGRKKLKDDIARIRDKYNIPESVYIHYLAKDSLANPFGETTVVYEQQLAADLRFPLDPLVEEVLRIVNLAHGQLHLTFCRFMSKVDLTEGRYLLSGASDGSAAIYDVQRATDHQEGGLIAKHKCIFVVDRQHEHGHKYAISSAIWYPVDTGLFITGSFDHCINVWDTNTTQVILNFKMPGKVYRTAMSSIATSHMLIAAGTEDVQVRLCDIASGAFTHTLSGHRDGVMTVEWSNSSEWVLVTGGCDGAIRFWDIRRAGCFLVLDQSHSQLGRRPPLLERSVTKVLASRSLPAGQSSFVKSRTPQRKTAFGNGAKQLPIYRVPSHTKGFMGQRLHPGMLSSGDRATAHYGAVTGLKVTGDGMYLLSAGSDSRLRLWDIESGCNTLVNFETVRLQTSKALQLAITQDSALVFVPCMTAVKAFDVWSGQTSLTFRGHYEYVNCCWFSSQDQELYTGGNDRQILVWSPSKSEADEVEEGSSKGKMSAMDQDNWSD
ncbi:hypothetical protein HHK36_008286 [Tetracentron sinense]|uniref:DNA excision repair protein ERCC-8 n=1 Tax=Tetracentron sinense TaxID=13715 RepID=A0A835DJW1_TETSI|nr:hypothetical protein HHK36_008286 [Tetracentron sinense]